MSKLMNMLLHNFNYGGRFVLISSSVQLNSCMEHLIQIVDFLSMKDNIHVLIKNSINRAIVSHFVSCANLLSIITHINNPSKCHVSPKKCFHIILLYEY